MNYESLLLFAFDEIYLNIDNELNPKYIEVCDENATTQKFTQNISNDIAITVILFISQIFFSGKIILPIVILFPFTNI